jgi:hypothetical protein
MLLVFVVVVLAAVWFLTRPQPSAAQVPEFAAIYVLLT